MNEQLEFDLPEVFEDDFSQGFEEGYKSCLEDIVTGLYYEQYNRYPTDRELFTEVNYLENGNSLVEKIMELEETK